MADKELPPLPPGFAAPRERGLAEIGSSTTVYHIPSSYVLVGKAGGGVFGDVYFCLPAEVCKDVDSKATKSHETTDTQLADDSVPNGGTTNSGAPNSEITDGEVTETKAEGNHHLSIGTTDSEVAETKAADNQAALYNLANEIVAMRVSSVTESDAADTHILSIGATDNEVTESKAADDQAAIRILVSQLVAVKIAAVHEVTGLDREIKTIKAIRAHAQSSPDKSAIAQQCFFELLEHDTINHFPAWSVTTTLPICCNIIEIRYDLEAMPDEFLWLVYDRLNSAVDFLHRKCNPPIAHGDLHLGNIIVGYPAPTAETGLAPGLPEIKLVDFGLSYINVNNKYPDGEPYEKVVDDRLNTDTRYFFCILDNIIHPSHWTKWDSTVCNQAVETKEPKHRSITCHTFHRQVNKVLWKPVTQPEEVVDLWNWFGKFTKMSVQNVNPRAQKRIRDIILYVAQGYYERSWYKIEEIVEASHGWT